MSAESTKDIESINTIKETLLILLNKMDLIEKVLVIPFNLSKRNDVRKYLNISESTLMNMMNDGRLKRGKHYIKEIKGNKSKITFIENAIIDFKENK